MPPHDVFEDVAYARALAEEGRHAPLVGGGYFILFGVLLAICYTAQWAVMARVLPIASSAIGAIWVCFGLAAGIGMALIGRRVRDLPGVSAVANRIDSAVWRGVALAILVVVAATVSRAIVNEDYGAPNAIVAAGFGLYGVALFATATAGGHLWLRNFALLAWVLSGLLWFFIGEAWLYLLAAGGCIAVLIVPGVIMMRREPSTIV